MRLQLYDMLSKIFMIFFSLFLVFLSIWNFIYPSQYSGFLLICCAIALLAVSIFLSSQKFGERALSMRNCYLRLDDLYFKVKNAEEGNSESLQEFNTIYNDILRNIENHSEYDYLRLKFSLRNKETTLPPFSKIDYCSLIIRTLIFGICILAVFLLPFIVQIIWVLLS